MGEVLSLKSFEFIFNIILASMGILNVDHTIISSEEVREREESGILVNSLIDDNVLTYE